MQISLDSIELEGEAILQMPDGYIPPEAMEGHIVPAIVEATSEEKFQF